MKIEFEKKIFWKIKKKCFFSGKFEKKIFSENCKKFFGRFSQGEAIIVGGGNYCVNSGIYEFIFKN